MTCPDVPRSVWRVCCNPIYMCVVLGTCCHVSSYVGFATFLTKYLQAHFGITAALASIYTGTRAPHCEIGTAGLQRFPIGTTKKTKKNLSDLLKTVASEMRLNFYRASAHSDARYWYSNSVRLSVYLSVRSSVRHDSVFYGNGWTYCHSFFTMVANHVFMSFKRLREILTGSPLSGALYTSGV